MSEALPPHLRALLATMSQDMGTPEDALLAQAVFTLARLHGYVVPSDLPGVSVDPEPPAAAGKSSVAPPGSTPPVAERAAGSTQEGASVSEAPPESDAESPRESTIVRRTNQAVRIRAIAEDVARLTTPYSPAPDPSHEDEASADDDEWLPDGDEEPWSASAFDDDGELDEDATTAEPRPDEAIAQGRLTETVDAREETEDEGPDELGVPAPPIPEIAAFDRAAEAEPGVSWDELDALADEANDVATAEAPESTEASAAEAASTGGVTRKHDAVPADEPAWVETEHPETSLDLQPVLAEATEAERGADVGPLLGSQRASEGDYDQLLADLDDLESGASSIPDEAVAAATDVVEARSRLTLTVEGAPEAVEVGATPFVIGRTRECDLQIVSERVSRKHAVIESAGPLGYRIVDRDSSNGLWLGRERIREHTLQDGDVFRVGDKRVRASITLFTAR